MPCGVMKAESDGAVFFKTAPFTLISAVHATSFPDVC